MPFGSRKIYFRRSFQFSIVTKKYHPSENLKLNNLGILKGLKFRILKRKIPLISLKLNFTPKTLGCYGLKITKLRSFPALHSFPKQVYRYSRWKKYFDQRICGSCKHEWTRTVFLRESAEKNYQYAFDWSGTPWHVNRKIHWHQSKVSHGNKIVKVLQ